MVRLERGVGSIKTFMLRSGATEDEGGTGASPGYTVSLSTGQASWLIPRSLAAPPPLILIPLRFHQHLPMSSSTGTRGSPRAGEPGASAQI